MASLVEPVLAPGFLSAHAQPTLQSDELTLRAWEASDRDKVLEAYADPQIQHWHVQTVIEHEVEGWIAQRRTRWSSETGADWAVVRDGVLVGRVSVRDLDPEQGTGEVSYWVLPAARGVGVARRSLLALTQWAKRTGLCRLELVHAVDNPASCRVAVASGYVLEGVHRCALLHADGWHDTHTHATLL